MPQIYEREHHRGVSLQITARLLYRFALHIKMSSVGLEMYFIFVSPAMQPAAEMVGWDRATFFQSPRNNLLASASISEHVFKDISGIKPYKIRVPDNFTACADIEHHLICNFFLFPIRDSFLPYTAPRGLRIAHQHAMLLS